MKSVRIRSYSGPYSVQMRENMVQNNSKCGHFSLSDIEPRLTLSLYNSETHLPVIGLGFPTIEYCGADGLVNPCVGE